MNQWQKWQARLIAREMVGILNAQSYQALYAEDLDAARELILGMIPPGSSVALGGSETLSAMGLVEAFRDGEYRFFDRYQKLPFPEIVEIYRQSMLADFLVTGSNAITRNGEIVNMDSSGNRAAGIIFGPRRVIIAAGVNKVVDTVADALKRIKAIAPLNAKRLGHPTPCAETGRCMDCLTPARICNAISIVNHGLKFEGRITVIIIADELGF